jgi:hypothetical protein
MSKRSKRIQPAPRANWRNLFRFRPKIWAGLFLIALFGVCGQLLWRQQAANIARHPQYQLTADAVQITPPPAWVRSDIKSEALRDAGLPGNLSLLDDWDTIVQRLRQAFEFHPWVASVQRITRRLPNSLQIELEYRRPLAAVASSGPGGITLSPVDVAAVRLPEADLTDAELSYLPRISNVAGRPMLGDTWEDPRVVGGVKLASALYDVWRQLGLVEILPSPHPFVLGESRYYSYEIVTNGGTRVLWGAAPGEETSAGESPFADKRQRLMEFAAASGRLDAIDGPASVDVRKELVVVPRTAKRGATESR